MYMDKVELVNFIDENDTYKLVNKWWAINLFMNGSNKEFYLMMK